MSIGVALVVASLGVVSAAFPRRTLAEESTYRGSYELEFTGSSTLHAFHGDVPEQQFELRSATIAGGKRYFAEIELAVEELTTGSGRRDLHMYSMFRVERWPKIRAVFDAIDPRRARPPDSPSQGGRGTLEFKLTIGDRTRSVEAQTRDWREDDEEASFLVEFDVSLRDFDLQAPRALLVIQVDDRVAVRVRISLSKR